MTAAGKIVRATAIVTLITLVVKGLGFAEEVLLAYFFGTGIGVDAYLVAYSLPFSASIVLQEAIEASFVPTYLRTWRESKPAALRLFGTVATLLLVLLGVGTAVRVLAAVPLVSLTAPGFAGEQSALAERLTRLVVPARLWLGLSTLTTATLHAHKRFNLSAVGDASFRAGPPAVLLATGGVMGTAVGVMLGALGKLVMETLGLGRRLPSVRPSIDLGFAPLRTVGRLAAPLLAAFFFSLFVGPLV